MIKDVIDGEEYINGKCFVCTEKLMANEIRRHCRRFDWTGFEDDPD
jgi:hypothetical protein